MDEKLIWEFTYHKGPAQLQGRVTAATQELGYLTAVEACKRANCRPPASVRPFVMADEEILGDEFLLEYWTEKATPAVQPEPVAAITTEPPKTITQRLGDKLVGTFS